MKRRSRIKIKIVIFSLIYLGFAYVGCSKTEQPKEYIARVGDKVLTKDDIPKLIDTTGLTKDEINEFIHNWVETELLAQAAENEDIQANDDFLTQENLNRKKLLAAKFLKSKLDEYQVIVSEKEIEEYYATRADDLIFLDNTYKLNMIYLNNFQKAVDFRNNISLKLDFKNAVNMFLKPEDKAETIFDIYLKDFELVPSVLAEMIPTMEVGEISYPIQIQKGKYLIVQLAGKSVSGEKPKLEFAREMIIERLKIEKMKSYYKSLISQLTEDIQIEIKDLD
ncbi:MAG: hypothetical protein N3A61_09770 [Ignavibacteria bacterium]|nr:hypothetical protein [Ignavibacteria bacterium]